MRRWKALTLSFPSAQNSASEDITTKYYGDLETPMDDETKIRGVELIFYLSRGESIYSYKIYAAADRHQLKVWD